MRGSILGLIAFVMACGGRQAGPAPVRPVAEEPAAAAPDPRIAAWAGVKAGDALPAGERAAARLPELEAMLGERDPAVRDGVGYEVLARWLMTEGVLDDAAVAGLRERLVARTAGQIEAGDAVLGRSFAALVLSVIAAREVARPVWSDADLEAQIAAATAYAARETDLRGYLGAAGWAHAGAHTADWMKFLARHPRLSAAQAERLLDGVAALVTRRHGARFSHGEDERLAAAVRAVARSQLVTDAQLDAWLARVAEPIARGWPQPFDPVLYAAQRNARDLLVSTFVALSFDDSAGGAAALARLRTFLAS